ncbi:MAG: haloacid dehalogenase [Acidimicrobiia bacterium]|nr:haloacid dehalogenase [Acidimicrobiia bacterium]
MAALADPARRRLDAANAARETGLAAARRTIQASSQSIRATHRLEWDQASRLAEEAGASLREAQGALAPYPQLAASGPLHDAAKEYVEANLTLALAADRPLASPTELGVSDASWLNGLAEAASELRRHLLDRLRAGDLEESERLLAAMDDVYALLVTVDYPDALTGGLRRTTDALRPVLERTRGDLTTTILQQRLQRTIEGRLPE